MQLADLEVGESLGVEVPYGDGGKMETMKVTRVEPDGVHVYMDFGGGNGGITATLPFEDLTWDDRMQEWVFYMPKTRLRLNSRSPALREKARSCRYRRVKSALDRRYADPRDEAKKRRRMKRRS